MNNKIQKMMFIKKQLEETKKELNKLRGLQESAKLSKLLEDDLEQAELIIAGKDIIDRLQRMAEDLAKIGAQQVFPLVDNMRSAFGPSIADMFEEAASGAIQESMDTIRHAKDSINNALLQISQNMHGGNGADMFGKQQSMPAPQNDMAKFDDELGAVDGKDDKDSEESDDMFGGSEEASGPEEEPLGRAKKEESFKFSGKPLSEKKNIRALEGKTYRRDSEDEEDVTSARKKNKEKRMKSKDKEKMDESYTRYGKKLLETESLSSLMSWLLKEAAVALPSDEFADFAVKASEKASQNPIKMAGWIGSKKYGPATAAQLNPPIITAKSDQPVVEDALDYASVPGRAVNPAKHSNISPEEKKLNTLYQHLKKMGFGDQEIKNDDLVLTPQQCIQLADFGNIDYKTPHQAAIVIHELISALADQLQYEEHDNAVAEEENSELEEKHIGFDKLEKKLGGSEHEAGALAAWIGRKKYGKKKFQKAAAAGKKLHEVDAYSQYELATDIAEAIVQNIREYGKGYASEVVSGFTTGVKINEDDNLTVMEAFTELYGMSPAKFSIKTMKEAKVFEDSPLSPQDQDHVKAAVSKIAGGMQTDKNLLNKPIQSVMSTLDPDQQNALKKVTNNQQSTTGTAPQTVGDLMKAAGVDSDDPNANNGPNSTSNNGMNSTTGTSSTTGASQPMGENKRTVRETASKDMIRAKSILSPLGINIKYDKDWKEYIVNFVGGKESTAYHSDDIEDAIGTGKLMATEKNKNVKENINAPHWPINTCGQYKGEPFSTDYGKLTAKTTKAEPESSVVSGKVSEPKSEKTKTEEKPKEKTSNMSSMKKEAPKKEEDNKESKSTEEKKPSIIKTFTKKKETEKVEQK